MGVENSLLVGLNLVVHLLRIDRSIEDYVLSFDDCPDSIKKVHQQTDQQ